MVIEEGVDTALLQGTVGGAAVAAVLLTDHQKRLEVGIVLRGGSMVEVVHVQGAVHLEVVTASPIITAVVIKKVNHWERKVLVEEEV